MPWKNDPDKESHAPKFTSPEKYIAAKLKILSRDFRIEPTDEELTELNNRTTEIGIDNYCLKIIANHWG